MANRNVFTADITDGQYQKGSYTTPEGNVRTGIHVFTTLSRSKQRVVPMVSTSQRVELSSSGVFCLWRFVAHIRIFPQNRSILQSCGKFYSVKPYFVLTRSSFSSIGSAPSQRKKNVAMARTRSTGRPVT